MINYNFSINSGYNYAIDRLKTQIKAIADDTPTAIYSDNNIFDYTSLLTVAISQANFPLCILKVDNEEMRSDSRQNSNLVIEIYTIFNRQDKSFATTLNQIISTTRNVLAETYSNEFKILEIQRDALPSELNESLNTFKPIWAIKYTIEYNNVRY